MEWLKDRLGINKYRVSWRFKWGDGEGHYEGNTDKYGRGPMTKRFAAQLAKSMCADYGPNSHWTERAA